jgi:hypothetical protein
MSIAGRRRESVSPHVQARAPKASSRSVRIRAQSLSCSPACLLASKPRRDVLLAEVAGGRRVVLLARTGHRLPFWPLARLAQDEERRCAGSEARSRGRLGKSPPSFEADSLKILCERGRPPTEKACFCDRHHIAGAVCGGINVPRPAAVGNRRVGTCHDQGVEP